MVCVVPPHAVLDPSASSGKFAGMIRRFIHGAMKSSLKELLEPALAEQTAAIGGLKAQMGQLETRIDRVDAKFDRLDVKVDAVGDRLGAKIDEVSSRLDAKIDAAAARLDAKINGSCNQLDAKITSLASRLDGFGSRLDAFGVQQGNLIKEVAGLRRERETTEDIVRRIGRLEDRLLRA